MRIRSQVTAIPEILEAAVHHQRSGRHAAALEECKRAVSAMPGDPQVHYILGFILLSQGRHAEAVESYS